MEAHRKSGDKLQGPPILIGEGIRLIPFMADSYFRLLEALIPGSESNPNEPAFPATAAIVAVATLESYVNELVAITGFDEVAETNDRIKAGLRKHGADLPGKLLGIRGRAAHPERFEDETLEEVRMLVGLRGLVAHYDPQEEHPTFTRTSLQRLAPRLGVSLPDENVAVGSLDLVLTPEMSRWAFDLTCRVIQQLYNAGFEPPRPRWLDLVDSSRRTWWKRHPGPRPAKVRPRALLHAFAIARPVCQVSEEWMVT
jgi:hypothetical protein